MVISPSSDPSPSPKLKRLKNMPSPTNSNPQHDRLDTDYSDGLDPLFSDSAKRVLEFSGPQYDVDDLFNKDMEILELRQQESGSERKSVGFKALPMVEKPISSVLEKIRQRKMEVSKKMGSRSVLKSDVEHREFTPHDNSIANASKFEPPVIEISQDKPCSSDEQTPSTDISVEETEKSFRAPVNDTQDLFSDFQASESQECSSNEESGNPIKDVSPSLTSLNLRLDSALPDDISSDEEESDKENTVPLPKSSSKHNFSGDPVKAFLDEEALEDDSDNDLLHSEDKDEENDADMEEHFDYIATDFKEKSVDHERRDQLHRTWLEQQDEAGTENLLQKLKYGVKQQEPTFLEVEVEDDSENEDKDDEGLEPEEDELDTDDDTENFIQKSTRATTRMLKQMIPLMFTDEDDGYVSSEDEVTKRSLSREHLLHKKELERKTESEAVAKDESSKQVFGCIRKLNSVPETKKKAKTPSFFDVMLTKGSGSNSNKSSFLRRASSHPAPTSNHKKGPSTGRSFIFGRDDSRSSAPITEDSPALNQSVSQVKRAVAAKFRGSQVKWSTQETQTRDDKVHETSLFEILKRSSSVQTIHDIQDNMVDHQAVFAAFKSVKKQIKVNGRL
ncbi:hypothetical protein KSS87_012186 [Heliosperma pusillum]|nr:hypothetical protein KSS87_012186 [Heliosperma pusillum]